MVRFIGSFGLVVGALVVWGCLDFSGLLCLGVFGGLGFGFGVWGEMAGECLGVWGLVGWGLCLLGSLVVDFVRVVCWIYW